MAKNGCGGVVVFGVVFGVVVVIESLVGGGSNRSSIWRRRRTRRRRSSFTLLSNWGNTKGTGTCTSGVFSTLLMDYDEHLIEFFWVWSIHTATGP